MPESDQRSDSELVLAAAKGDEHAFEELYVRHRDFVYRTARRYTGDHQTALDVAQEAFLILLNKLPTLKLTGRLSTYLYPIIKNLALAKHRTDQRHARIQQQLATESSCSPSEADSNLAMALAKLSEDHREVLILRVVDGLSVDEVALALSIAPGTVKSRLHHALQHLREVWPGIEHLF